MVLEGGSTPEENFTTDTPPSSDLDPYGDQNPPFTSTRQPSFTTVGRDGNDQIYVNIANLPRPFSLLGTSNHPAVLIESIKDSCRFAQQVLKRPPRQEEADAFAFHAAKTYRIASFGSPTGMALASVQFYRKKDIFRFPGYTPFKEGGRFSPDRLGPLQGQMARYGWHSMRLSAYWVLGSVAGAIFFGSYAVSVSLAGRNLDPRLKEFTQRLRELQKEGTSMQSIRRQQDTNSTTQEETFEQRRQRRNVQGMNRESTEKKGNSYGDDMSPTGGAFGAEYTEAQMDTGLMNDDQMQTRQIQQQGDARSSSAENTGSTFDMDMAVPRSAASSRTSAGQGEGQKENRSAGSSWERLRQQAGNGKNSSGNRSQQPASSGMPARVQGEQRQGSTLGDSFSFSESDEERQLAKSEAQRDFDARIEREREGKDFEEKGRGRKNW